MPKRELPVLTHGGHAEFLSAELDYEEMTAALRIARALMRMAIFSSVSSLRVQLIGGRSPARGRG